MYEEKKNNKTETTQEDTTDAIRKVVAKMQIEHIMNQFGDDADAMLGWLARRAGNQKPINGHRLDNLEIPRAVVVPEQLVDGHQGIGDAELGVMVLDDFYCR